MSLNKEETLLWVWLTSLENIGPVTARKLWEHFKDINAIYDAAEADLTKVKGIYQRQKEEILCHKNLDLAHTILEDSAKHGMDILTVDQPDYPERCRDLPDISPVLYVKGQNAINTHKTVGIIGKRRCSEEGKRKAILLAQNICKANMAIVSGFAKGIDSYAHTAAIKADGYTIGVLGNGIDICYPSEQYALKEIMEKKGLLISQFPPGTVPQKHTFPLRNRLIAALSDELYIVERGTISGTQSTIDAAEKYGRRVDYQK